MDLDIQLLFDACLSMIKLPFIILVLGVIIVFIGYMFHRSYKKLRKK